LKTYQRLSENLWNSFWYLVNLIIYFKKKKKEKKGEFNS
jgi:hypothetical protein